MGRMPHESTQLPEIAIYSIGRGGALGLLDAAPERARALLEGAARRYSRPGLRLGDALSRRWLRRNGNPHLAEIETIAARLAKPGGWFLNLSYEWGCTSGVGPDPDGQGCRLVRTLDWPADGLGRHLVLAREQGPAGAYLNPTWPGFVGMVQGMAPGRFAAALNQAPFARALPKPLAWAAERRQMWRARSLPPLHLLRRVFQEAGDYAAARRLLIEVPICLPAIFSLVGIAPEECCIIERWPGEARAHDGPGAAANHWLSRPSGTPRGNESERRLACMRDALPAANDDLGWLVPPILNETTRLAMVANPASGRLTLQAFEAPGAVSRPLRLAA
jgi:hypothetical protein